MWCLQWLAELVQCIECGVDGYFTQIFLFFFTCMSLPSSSESCPLAQVACLMLPEVSSFIGLLGESTPSSFLLIFLSVCWVRTGPTSSIPYLNLTPPTIYIYIYIYICLESCFYYVGKLRTKHVWSMYQAMLKSGCFKVQVQLIAKKGSVVLPCSTDRELDLIDQKSQVQFFCIIFKQA